MNIKGIPEYKDVKDRLFVRACGKSLKEKRKNWIFGKVRQAQDIYLGVGIDFGSTREGFVSAMVTEEILGLWGVSIEQLFADAWKSQSKIRPTEVISMADILGELTGIEGEKEPGFLVLTNSLRVNGASGVFAPGELNRIFEKIGKFYILPSSVHEVLILPDNGDWVDLSLMVRSINSEFVEEDERLSDSAFYYDGKELAEV